MLVFPAAKRRTSLSTSVPGSCGPSSAPATSGGDAAWLSSAATRRRSSTVLLTSGRTAFSPCGARVAYNGNGLALEVGPTQAIIRVCVWHAEHRGSLRFTMLIA